MPTARRYLDAQVRGDLERKMVFVAGSRQVGKTTLAAGLATTAPCSFARR
jgi:predicted AAA+ superfamily ATPase